MLGDRDWVISLIVNTDRWPPDPYPRVPAGRPRQDRPIPRSPTLPDDTEPLGVLRDQEQGNSQRSPPVCMRSVYALGCARVNIPTHTPTTYDGAGARPPDHLQCARTAGHEP